ncbi:hypothetical protein [Parapedobacter sp. DT-150]|uniref:hypothetical protein n=1 Tax=Parapedobacter sp. DT-150 TaxID=3396162 RepID=UPI003F1A6B3B
MEKAYRLHDCLMVVGIEEGHIRIANDAAFKRMVTLQPVRAVTQLVNLIKADYQRHYGKPIVITDDSFAVEIWAHLYFEYFLLKYHRLFRFVFRFGLYRRFLRSCEVIDCGERGIDPNRRMWDILAPFRGRIAKWLPKNPSLQQK